MGLISFAKIIFKNLLKLSQFFLPYIIINKVRQRHDKTNKMSVRPAKT